MVASGFVTSIEGPNGSEGWSTVKKALCREDFRRALREIFGSAESEGREFVEVRSGDLHRAVGEHPGPDHRMPVCCSVMEEVMTDGDRIVRAPPKGRGANFVYSVPHSSSDLSTSPV